MRIIFVSAPLSDTNAQRAGLLLEQAIQELCLEHPGFECIVVPGKELPGMLAFTERQKQKQAIRSLNPDVVVFASPVNLLPLKGVSIVVLLTAGANEPENRLAGKHHSSVAGFITDSGQLKKDLSRSLEIPVERISVIPFVEEIIVDQNVQDLRNQHTLGSEYFFYSGAVHAESQWERVLQAFSQFKKWQQSGLKLLLAGNTMPAYSSTFREKLNAYKYRDEIICLDLANAERTKLISASFAVLSTGNLFDERMDIVKAFCAGIPVIAHNGAVSKELCGDSALYADFADAKDLSQQLISVYKNEGIYNHLTEKGRLASSRFSRRQMLDQLHAALQEATEQ